MTSKKQLAMRAFRNLMRRKADTVVTQRGVLGDGAGNVQVANRPDRCYMRMRAAGEAVWTVFNLKIDPINDLPVRIRRTEAGDDWEVYDVDYSALTNAGQGWGGSSASTGPHHAKHEWPDGMPGADPVSVYPRALSMLRTFRKNSTSLTVRVSPLRYTYDGAPMEFTGNEMQLYTYQPAPGLARYVATYLDPVANVAWAHPGATTIDSAAVVPPMPLFPVPCYPSALVRLSGNKTYLSEPDFVDYRLVLSDIASTTGDGAGHDPVTLGTGSSEALVLAGQELTLTTVVESAVEPSPMYPGQFWVDTA